MERYEQENGRYVLYIGSTRAAVTRHVALLVDSLTGSLITHGDPRSVRRELDALRATAPEATAGLLLLEGQPELAALNRALRGEVDVHDLHLSFLKASARRLTGELIARLRQRRMT